MVEEVKKRNGEIVEFNQEKITSAIHNALRETSEGSEKDAKRLSDIVVEKLDKDFKTMIPGIEKIQDIAVDTLMEEDFKETAKAYILYRNQRRVLRETKSKEIEAHIKLKNLSLNAVKVLARRYLQRDDEDRITETPDQLFRRVAKSVAEIDLQHGKKKKEVRELEEIFYELMTDQVFMPNSPTLFNAGTGNNLTLSACFVLPIKDDLGEIFETLKNMAIVQKAGGGTGFAFSHLRPKGDIVHSTGGRAQVL